MIIFDDDLMFLEFDYGRILGRGVQTARAVHSLLSRRQLGVAGSGLGVAHPGPVGWRMIGNVGEPGICIGGGGPLDLESYPDIRLEDTSHGRLEYCD